MGTSIVKFESISEASQILDISRSAISNNLTGRSLTAGKYRWKYAN